MLLGDVAERAVDGFDAQFRKLAVLRDAHLGVDVVAVRQVRVVELEDDARVGDRLVLLVHGVGDGEQHVFLRG